MESSHPARVLVVAHKTAPAPHLFDAVRERAGRGDAAFTLLIPNVARGLHRVVDPEDQEDAEARQALEHALPRMREAASGEVRGLVGSSDPLCAIEDAINLHGFDEVIISTLPVHVSHWLRMDLPAKVAGLGLPVTTVTADA